MSSDAGPSLVPLSEIHAAAARIQAVARRTPLVPASADPRRGALRLKCENLQTTGSFKIRGAANMLAQLDRAVLDRGVITYSSGNHGQALACAARLASAPAVIVMPTTAPAVKVAGARAYGAEVVFAGATSADRKREAERIAADRGLTMVPPFEHPWIIAGQGTVGLEILDAAPDVQAIYVPVGGGGLLSGVAAAVKRLRPGVRIVGVEPAGAPKMRVSLDRGRPVTLDRSASIADGLLPVRPGDLTFAHVRALVDDVVTVSEEAIADAVGWLARESKLVVEPSGAASVAAIRERHAVLDDDGVHIVAVLSGGNVSPEKYADMLLRSSRV
jgi:threo-3-hydroxy-L-aspartate ammonia-lyase